MNLCHGDTHIGPFIRSRIPDGWLGYDWRHCCQCNSDVTTLTAAKAQQMPMAVHKEVA